MYEGRHITESDLRGFTGTENHYKHSLSKLVYTDGVRFMAGHGGNSGAYWLIDAIGSYQRDRRITTNEDLQYFQLWELTVTDGRVVLTCKADSNKPAIITQNIEYTDFEFSIKLYVENGCLLLPSEH